MKVSIMLVYVPHDQKLREKVYNDIEVKLRHAKSLFMVIGDFNENLQVGDRNGLQRGKCMKVFCEWVSKLQLRHIPLINEPRTFTCYSKNSVSWLDRVFVEGQYLPDLNVWALID